MTYRDLPLEEPLIVVGAAGVQCFDAASGALRWSHAEVFESLVRCTASGELLLVTNGNQLTVLSRHDGRVLNRARVAFTIASVLSNGPFVVVAGPGGSATFRDGAYVWGVRRSIDHWVLENAVGTQIARLPFWCAQGARDQIALVLGSSVAQTDRVD